MNEVRVKPIAWGEIAVVALLSLVLFSLGRAMNYLAVILFLAWPLFFFQIVFELVLYGIWAVARRLIWGKRPEPPPQPTATKGMRLLWMTPWFGLVAGMGVAFFTEGFLFGGAI